MTRAELIAQFLAGSQPDSAVWKDYLPLLAIFGAAAAYIGAIRLWYHKVRMDATDALKKADAELAAKKGDERKALKRHYPVHLKRRRAQAVVWLRCLVLLDVVALAGAIGVFRHAFGEWFPAYVNWHKGGPFSWFVFALQMMWLALLLFTAAHLFSALSAWWPDRERPQKRVPLYLEPLVWLVGSVVLGVFLHG
jgi:hypothetical protein